MKTQLLSVITFTTTTLFINSVKAQSSAQSVAGGHLWGSVFGDYAYVAHGDSAGRGNGNVQYKGLGSATSGTSNPNAFEIRRAYLAYDYVINPKFTVNVLLNYDGNTDANGNRTFFLKVASFTWKNIFPKSDLGIGQQLTNSYTDSPYQTEQLFGYRSIERSLLDMRKVDGAADMGAKLTGRIWTAKPADTGKTHTFIGYSIMIGNNSGYAPVPGFSATTQPFNTTTDKDKKFRGNVYLNTLNGKLTLGAYADFINYGNAAYTHTGIYPNSVSTIKGYAVYKQKHFEIGVEGFQQSGTNDEFIVYKKGTGTNDTTTATQAGYSLFAYLNILPNKLNIFGRYDYYTPDTKITNNTNITYTDKLIPANTYTETFISGGLDWTPVDDKKVHFMPNIWYDGINGISGSDNLKSSYYLVYRITFFYIFK